MINLYNVDCMEFMRGLPDKCYELAIVDPPYGIGEDGLKNHSRSKLAKSKKYIPKNWDKEPPNEAYFKELIRVSKNQIIWGANHFISKIPYFIQLDERNIYYFFDKDVENDFNSYPNGFISPKVVLPGQFSNLGLQKYNNFCKWLLEFDKGYKVLSQIYVSLYHKFLNGKNLLDCFPEIFDDSNFDKICSTIQYWLSMKHDSIDMLELSLEKKRLMDLYFKNV